MNMIGNYQFNDEKGHWEQLVSYENKDDDLIQEWCGCVAVDVPVEYLLIEYENLLAELSNKEIHLINLKETYLQLEQDIINNTNFKALYGKNNDTVRKNHVKNELKDMVDERNSLELSIAWIKRYISFLKELIRTKRSLQGDL